MCKIAFKKIPNNDYYYFGKDGTTELMVINSKGQSGRIGVLYPITPKELIGKKVRLKLELIEND